MGEGRGGGNNCSTTSGGGGSYGGAGTAGWCSAAGPAYGNLTHGGADMGSGGGFVTNSGGSGGGAIVLNATGRLESNGTILANGQNALSDRSGGGSGGGVTLIAGTLYWLGGINVSGGAGGDSGPAGNGGGGRISAWFDSNQSAIMVNVSGATNIADTAAVGSTYSNNRPFVNLTSPLNSSYGTTLALNFTPSYFNGTTVTCGYALDGVDSEIGSVENNSLNSSSLSGLADGLHSVSVNCTNVTALFAVETTRVAGPIFFTVDATAPYYQDNSTTYPAVYTDSPSTVWLNTSWADGVSLDAVLFEVDGANYTPLADPSDSSIRFLSWAAMAAGDHYWVSYANDTAGNFNATGNMTFSIAQAPVGVTLKANDSTASDQRFNAPNITNITAAFNVSASGVTYELLYNGSASNETLNSTGGPTIVFVWSQLNATVLNFSARLNATQNYSGASASFRVSFPDVIASQYSDVAAAVPEVYDPESVVWLNASWTDNIGVTQVLVELDGTNYSATQDGSVYFLRLDSLAAGDHFWREHANDAFDNYNLTANTTFTIARAPVNATVYTNGSPSNSTQTLIPNVFNFTATKNVSEGVIELITNYTGSDIRLSSTTGASTSFLWNQSNNSGVLVTARYNQTENYSAAGTSMQVTFLTHAPNYTANTSLTPGVFQDGFQHWFNATWTDDVAVAIVLFDIDGVNQTPLQDPSDASKYFVRLGALPSGLHWWQAYANDTAGAMNATGNVTFTTLQAPVNASVYVNDSPANRSTEALILNFTATKNVSEGIIELLYNETGSTLAAGSSQQVYLIWLQGNLSSYQLIARYNATQNYSLSNSSLNITIYDVTSPVVNNASVNESVAYRNNSLLFAANATDLWLGAVWIETNHSGAWANYTIDTGFNSIYNYTIPGLNYSDHEIIGYRFWANDSSGNNASTSIAVFKISNLGAPNGSLLASPANNSIIVYNNATLNWTAATDIDNDTITYLVQSSNDSGFSVVSLNLSFVSTNGFINLNQPGSAINISTPLQAQYWRVAAFDGVAYSEWSDINNATVVFAVISSGIANNSVVRNATAFNLTVTEVQGEAWINNVTATISSTQYQLSDDGNWNYAWTPSYASPQVLHIAFNAYNQTMEDPSVYVTDAIDVRLGRAAGLTQSPIVSSLCPNATYATNGSNVTIQLNYYVDTLSELDYLTLSAPSSYDYNLTPYVSSLSGLNLSRNYSFIANESGNYTLTAYLTDLENQSVTGVSWFYADTAFIMANFSVNGFNLAAERDACGNPLNAASNYTYVRPPGPVDVEANTSALSVLFKSLNLSSNTSFGQALNLSDLLNTAYNVSVPSGYRRVAQFELNSSLENYSYALIVYNYSSIAGSLDNESSLHVFKCSNHSGCSNTTMTNVTATVFTNNQTLVFNTTTFSIYTVAEASSSVVVTVTPTPAPTPTPQVITNTVYSGGGGAYREVSVEKQVLKSVEIISPPLQLSTYSNDTILAPIVLTNAEDVDFHNVSLTASSDSPEHITLEFDKAYYDIIPVGEHRISNLSISTHSPLGVYNVTVTARVGSPNITQSTRIFVDLVERGGQISVNVAETLQFARDLFKQNPECLELSEFLTLAQDELEKGNYEKAKSYVDLSVDSCRDLLARKPGQMQIASNEPPLVAGGYSWQDYAIVAGAALVLLATAFLYLRSRRGKGPKHREHAVAKPSAPEERRERYHPHSRR
ncbi:hypothetical protein AUJ14_03095 [Candidatus Micrarchaeota archaeon CG1_02_55_22]|nr:MAG: hypothetical protein AUJ14_03095 [Candidatus Micrarchaeota archaeon CG1_02_55_22]